LIEAKGVTKSYGNVVALRDVSFKFSKGVCGVVGPNGAGKTTLIKILVGLLKPDAGRVEVEGLQPFRQRESILKGMGIMHQNDVFPAWATGKQYLRFAASLKGIRARKQAIDEAAELARIEFALDRVISGYSGGMTKRLSLAVALLGLPKLILMDEPTADLDPISRAAFLEDISRLEKDNDVSFMISTHLLPDLEKVCSDLLVLREGRMLGYGKLSSFSRWPNKTVFEISSSNLAGLASAMEREKVAAVVETNATAIRVVVDDESEFFKNLKELCNKSGFELHSLKRADTSIEEIFVDMMRNVQPS
jgi:ABC-type multidrug transport system ATPase subunit